MAIRLINNWDGSELERSFYISDRVKSIQAKQALIDALKVRESQRDKARVSVDHAIVNEEEMLLFSVEGKEDGVAVSLADIESGKITMQQAIDELFGKTAD